MSKFKVGDKVRVKSEIKKYERHGGYEVDASMYAMRGKITTITKIDTDGAYLLSGYAKAFWEDWMIEPVREFIVIHRSGNVMTAEHRLNRDVIKSAKATCAPSDTFDFNTGAKLAFDRLMGREEQSSLSPADIFFAFTGRPAPEPPKFYTGSVRCTGCTPIATFAYEGWIGKIITFKDGYSNFYGKDNNKYRFTSFEDFCKKNNQGTFAEVKPDVR